MIGLWHAAVGDWLHGSSYVYVSCSLQSISKHYRVDTISLFSKRKKAFVLINPPTNYIITSITIMSCAQFLWWVYNIGKIEQQFLHKTTDLEQKSG